MSNLVQKLINNSCVTSEDWEAHLVESHKVAQSMTPRTFASYKTKDGINSYELLAHSLDPLTGPLFVLDLACGDGYLIQFLLTKLGKTGTLLGIDMSSDELAVAQRVYPESSNVRFHLARAQSLPVPNQSIDAVLCHMAFMLMTPIEPVVAELARVLKPGGVFAAIIGGSKDAVGVLKEIQHTAFELIESNYPGIGNVQSGDPRVSSLEGLREIFRPDLGFAEKIDLQAFPLQISMPPDGIWDFMKDMYFVSMLNKEEKQTLRKRFEELGHKRKGDDGLLRFEWPMKRIEVRKT